MAQLQQTTYVSTSNALTHSITLSQPATAGSVMVIMAASNAMISPGTGWTLAAENVTYLHTAGFTRVMAGNETTINVTLSANVDLYANIYEFNDVEVNTTFSTGTVDTWFYGANLGDNSHTPSVASRFFTLYTNNELSVDQVVTWTEPEFTPNEYTAETQNTQFPAFATSSHRILDAGVQTSAEILLAVRIAGETRGAAFALPLTTTTQPPATVSTRFWLNSDGDWVPVNTTQL